jgi:hypothetical protein
MAENVLTKEIAEQFLADEESVDLSEFTELDDEAASSLLAVLLAIGWAKEFRLRRALQNLLARFFTHWRKDHETHSVLPPNVDVPSPGNGVDDRRMR